jgi:phosphoserine phosphatase
MSELKAVAFDIDGTLAPGVSWLDLTAGLGAAPERHQEIFRAFLAGEIDYPESKVQLLGLWQGTGKANKAAMTRIFSAWPLAPGAEEVIAVLKQRYRLCLITGSMSLYAEVVAARLGIDDWYANTRLDWDESGNLIDYHYVKDQAGQKLLDLQSFCAKYGLKPEECVAVGDSDNDRAIFDATKHGVLIAATGEPSTELAPHAWRTIRTLTQLPELL